MSAESIAEIILAGTTQQDEVLPLDKEVAEALLEEDAGAYSRAAQPALPRELQAINEELQEAARKLRQSSASSSNAQPPEEGYWQPPPTDMKWTKQVGSVQTSGRALFTSATHNILSHEPRHHAKMHKSYYILIY